ncbi:hypothetical protein [Sphingomonas sp. Leaf343]|uniref:hypothetical protein n=1 Tax=Sphingomonas sp. Leaf343 TaxID=1736345 RepID=UPI0006FE30F0|nr:hypothetical protein [Sphingomonas sp. Leaf343]KQR83224.1 hypothetical protein ASG07_09720 [Sphingomonas sp. Leaf343]
MVSPSTFALLLLQTTVVASPGYDIAGAKTPDDIRAQFLQRATQTRVPSTPDRPIRITSLPSSSAILSGQRSLNESIVRAKRTTIVPPLKPLAVDGCRKVVEFARGYTLRGSSVLNGRSSTFDCGTFVAIVVDEDFGRPLDVLTVSGFDPADMAAVVNGGALARSFRLGKTGAKEVVYRWVRPGRALTIELTSDANDYPTLVRAGDAILNSVTSG